MTIGFTQDAYMVPEGVGFLNVTIDVVGTPGRSVIIILTTQDGVAVCKCVNAGNGTVGQVGHITCLYHIYLVEIKL